MLGTLKRLQKLRMPNALGRIVFGFELNFRSSPSSLCSCMLDLYSLTPPVLAVWTPGCLITGCATSPPPPGPSPPAVNTETSALRESLTSPHLRSSTEHIVSLHHFLVTSLLLLVKVLCFALHVSYCRELSDERLTS